MENLITSQINSDTNDDSNLSDIASNRNEYRWFWNYSPDPWDPNGADHLWAQYELDLSDEIEQSYLSKLPQHELNEEYIIQFDYNTYQHLQMHKVDHLKQRPVLRQIPSKVKEPIRIDRWSVTEHEPFKMYENNYIDQLQMFCYSKIFSKVQIDKSDCFIQQFTSYVTILDKTIASFLENDYVCYLQNIHQLQYLDFNKLKNILSNDLKHQKAYIFHYVNHLTQKNFKEIITEMYTAEGQLYKTLNKAIRSMSLNQHMEYIFFFLCFVYVQGCRKNRIDKDVTVFRGVSITNEVYEKIKTMYAVDQVVINYDFMSSSRKPNQAKKFMYINNLPKKILFEIQIEKESDSNPFLSFKPFDVANMSAYPGEEEIILPPNGVFQVRNFLEEGNNRDYTTIQMEYRTNLFTDSLPFILKESQIALQFGLYNADLELKNDDFQQIISVQNSIKNNNNINIQLLSKMINLHYLYLSWNIRGDEGMKEFASQLIHLTQLQHLYLSSNQIGDEGMKAFASQLIHLTQLQQLNLSWNKIGDEGMKAFASQLSHLTQLQHLYLEHNQIGDEGMKAFASQLSHLTQLQHLDLSKNKIGAEGMKAFASQLSHLTQLQQLNLYGNKIGDEGMKPFAPPQLIHLTQLQHLYLEHNQIGDEGIKAFASQLINLTQLQQLNLNSNQIGDEGIKEFASHLSHLTQLQKLNLSWNQIGDEGMKAFALQLIYLTQLQQLNLDGNKISGKVREALRLHLKNF